MKFPDPARRSLIAAVVLLTMLLLVLFGCGGEEEKKAAQEKPKQADQASKQDAGQKKSETNQAGDTKNAGNKQKAAAQEAAQKAPSFKVVKVTPVDAPLLKEYSASIQAKEEVDIRARVAGYLQKRFYTEGAMVKKGDPLFKIEPSEYQQALKQAQSQLARDKATLDKARTDVQRFGDLFKAGAISREEYDTRLTTFKEYQATVEQDEAAVQQAQLNLSYTDITAPVTGRIGRAQAQVGDLVGHGENTLLAKITTVDPVYVNFSISEQDYLSYVKDVQKRKADHKAPPKVQLLLKLSDDSIYGHRGQINMVDPSVDPQTGTLGIRATFPNPEDILRPGQFARILLAVQREEKVILVPQRAVMDVQGMKMCLVADKDSKLQSKSLQLGQELSSFVVVEKGLESGDLVLVEGLQKVKAGDTIDPQVSELDLSPLRKEFDGGEASAALDNSFDDSAKGDTQAATDTAKPAHDEAQQ